MANLFKNSVLLVFCMSLLACAAKKDAKPKNDMASMKSPEEMQALMMEAGKPVSQHRKLASLAGKWKAKSMWKMAPDAPAEKSNAISEKVMTLNGLFLKENYVDKNAKHPFEGMGIMGYDKVMNRYTSNWFDTMTSAAWRSTGRMVDKGVIEFIGGGSCPMTGDYKEVTSQLKIVSPDKHVLSMYDTAPDGQRFKTLEIVYTR